MSCPPTHGDVRQSVLQVIDVVWKKGAEPIIAPESPNVASLIVLGDDASATFADEMQRQRDHGNVGSVVEHTAHVTKDGELIVAGQGPKGAFAFIVPAGGWGWCRPLM